MKPVVLVHGAWHGAWCWELVQRELDAARVPSVAVHLPFTGLADDAERVAQVIVDTVGTHREPAIVVGHSYGGLVISDAVAALLADDATASAVDHLVYLCALLAESGERPAGGSAAPATLLLSAIRRDPDRLSTIDPAGAVAALYRDAARARPAAVEDAIGRLRPFPIDALRTCTGEPWRRLPTTYVRCLDDQAIHPDQQAAMAAVATAASGANRVVDWACDHSPFLGRPGLVTDLLVPLAKG